MEWSGQGGEVGNQVSLDFGGKLEDAGEGDEGDQRAGKRKEAGGIWNHTANTSVLLTTTIC